MKQKLLVILLVSGCETAASQRCMDVVENGRTVSHCYEFSECLEAESYLQDTTQVLRYCHLHFAFDEYELED